MTSATLASSTERAYRDFQRPRWQRLLLTREMAVVAALIAVIVVASLAVDNFAAPITYTYLFLDVAAILLIALPMTLVITTGEIDLSVASVVGLSSVLTGTLYQAGLPFAVAALLGGDVRMIPTPHMAGLADGEYRFGVRANNLFMARRNADDAEIEGTVELAEISGSETFVHVDHHGVSWVAQEDGVQRFELNQPVRLYVNPRSLFVFDMSGALAAAPARAAVHEKTVNGGETAHG